MSQFGIVIIPLAIEQLGSSDTKATDDTVGTEWKNQGASIVLTPASDEYIEFTKYEVEYGIDTSLSIRYDAGYAVQREGEAEGTPVTAAWTVSDTGDLRCTNNTFLSGSHNVSPVIKGEIGKTLTIIPKVKSNWNPTTICTRNRRATGRKVRTRNVIFGGQFGGQF